MPIHAPSLALPSAFSSVVREPLNGLPTVLPLDLALPHPVTSHRSVIRSLITLCEVWRSGRVRKPPAL